MNKITESLKEVIARLKQNSQQQVKVIKQEIPAIVKQEIQVPAELEDGNDDADDYINEETELETAKEVPKIDSKEQERIQTILEEIEMLQNNGRFRAELLHQMQEINQALVVIAGALANLSKNDKA